MRLQILFKFIIITFLSGCSGRTEMPKNANNSNSSQNAAANGSLYTNRPPESAKVDDANSVKPTVEGFYQALQKKDEMAAKKYLSAPALKYYEEEARSEKKSWFAFLLEAEDPVEEKREVRNEKLQGDKGTAEIKGGSLGIWTPIAFIKENGEWKFDSPRKSFEGINIERTQSTPKTGK